MVPLKNRLGLVGLALVSMFLVAGCNDTLRQFITPVPKPGGDPSTLANAVVLSQNPAGNGSTLHIDVSGDSISGVVTTGPNPVFFGKSSSRIYILNGDNTVTTYNGLLPLQSQPSVVTQPVAASGAISGSGSSVGNFYLANQPSGNSSMIAPSGSLFAVTSLVPVGTGPVAIAGNSSNNKIYVVNHDSNTVTVISTTDNTIIGSIDLANVPAPLKPGVNPIWGVMSSDGVHVFIVNQGDGTAGHTGSVSVIDTFLDQIITTIDVGQNPAISSPNYAIYDPTLQRLYVSNTGENTVSVIDASRIDLAAVPQLLPKLLANIPVSGAPTSVAALSNGTRVYAALGNCPAGTNHTNLVQTPTLTTPPNLPSCTGNLVSVISTNSLREIKTIQVGPGAVSIDAAPDSSRVYVVSALDTTTISDNVNNPAQANRVFSTPSVSVITTTTDEVFRPPSDPSIIGLVPTFHAPQQSASCVPAIDPTFNSKVALPCPLQNAFLVRTLP
ncbi:MAG TPA: YncE family protein [Terriglobales bacterium]|nr:YncE family protein [Terriglobales bacterium]